MFLLYIFSFMFMIIVAGICIAKIFDPDTFGSDGDSENETRLAGFLGFLMSILVVVTLLLTIVQIYK